MTLIAQIQEYARQRPFEWVNGVVYEFLAMTEWVGDDGKHFKASNASRRLRELEEQGILEVRRNERNNVEYKYISIMQQIAQKEIKKIDPPKVETQGMLI